MHRSDLRKAITDQLIAFRAPAQHVHRQLPNDFNRQLNTPEIGVITGVRRCGKSTLFRQIASELPSKSKAYFLDLEDSALLDFSLKDFQIVYDLWMELDPPGEERVYLFYDELQNVKGWERWVRTAAQFPNHKVFITGSNSQMLSSELASTLTGRHVPTHLMPFSLSEIIENELEFSKLSKLEQHASTTQVRINLIIESFLKIGGFPRCYLERSNELLSLYFSDIVSRDIIKRRNVRSSAALVRLGEILCRENTRLFNRRKTAALLGIKDNSTFAKYCDYFKECYLFYEVRQSSPSLRKQMRSLSKFYCIDPALPRAVAGSASNGHSAEFENLVFLELRRKFEKIGYWSSETGEVDFVVDSTHGEYAIQAAYSVDDDDTLKRELGALIAIHKEQGIKNLFIVTAAETRVVEASGVQVKVIPVTQVASDI